MSIAAAVHAFLAHAPRPDGDYADCLVVIPHHHLGQAFRRELMRQTGSAVLPPRLVTLPDLAEAAPDCRRPVPESRMLAEFHDLLAGMPRLMERAPLWQAARELADLMGEMETACLGDMALAGLYGTTNPHLSAEASIADAIWRACRVDPPLAQGLYGERLMQLARNARQPLYRLGLMDLSAREQAFFHEWARHAAVIELSMPPAHLHRKEFLDSAWAVREPSLRSRALEFASTRPDSPVARDWMLLPASGLEEAAHSAAAQVASWVRQGRREIALLALDRLLARRLRALLERDEILVQDETGWALSTASASHVLDRWLSLLGPALSHGDLLDLLKSPFVRVSPNPDLAVSQLEEALRRHGPARDLEGHQALAREQGLSAALAALNRIAQARALFPARRGRLEQWTRALLSSLEILDALEPLGLDPVGGQILSLLGRLERECAEHGSAYSLADWRNWLSMHLEQGVFTETSVESPIRLTHLAAAHHRGWEAVLVLGSGAAHLPGNFQARVFSEASRRQLGLPGVAHRESALRAALADLLCRAGEIAFVWQREESGEELPLSPWLIQLDAFHAMAWGSGLPRRPPPLRRRAGGLPGMHSPAVCATPPDALSVSAWQSLLNCPFQFHARYLLGLKAPDEVAEELEKSDYGILVHRLLAEFHAAHPVLSVRDRADLEADLQERSRAVFAIFEERDYAALAWSIRWQHRLSAYLDWAITWEAEGRRFREHEVELEREVIWRDAETMTRTTRLHGRADRVDEQGEARIVLDYKTMPRSVLKSKTSPAAEDVQLPTYAWLAGASMAGFVALDDKDKAQVVSWQGDLAEASLAEAQRLSDTFTAMAAGVPLLPQGAPEVCQWCEMRGLCRVEHPVP